MQQSWEAQTTQKDKEAQVERLVDWYGKIKLPYLMMFVT